MRLFKKFVENATRHMTLRGMNDVLKALLVRSFEVQNLLLAKFAIVTTFTDHEGLKNQEAI